jgi:hypothetical protein
MVITVANVSRTCCEVFVVNYFCVCFHMVETVATPLSCTLASLLCTQGSYKQMAAILKRGPPPCRLSQYCCHAFFFLFPLKNNRHDTFLACRNYRPDRTQVCLNDTAVTVVNCCQRVATRLYKITCI